jgi:hypothetical protein
MRESQISEFRVDYWQTEDNCPEAASAFRLRFQIMRDAAWKISTRIRPPVIGPFCT